MADLSVGAPLLDLILMAPPVLLPPNQFSFPIGSTFGPDGTTVYVAHAGEIAGGWIDAFDAASGTRLFSLGIAQLGFSFDFGALPWNLQTNAAGTRLFFAHQLANALVTVDLTTETVLPFLPLGARPRALAINAAGDRVYVSLTPAPIRAAVRTSSRLQRRA